jgi:hypothetical protein
LQLAFRRESTDHLRTFIRDELLHNCGMMNRFRVPYPRHASVRRDPEAAIPDTNSQHMIDRGNRRLDVEFSRTPQPSGSATRLLLEKAVEAIAAFAELPLAVGVVETAPATEALGATSPAAPILRL